MLLSIGATCLGAAVGKGFVGKGVLANMCWGSHFSWSFPAGEEEGSC